MSVRWLKLGVLLALSLAAVPAVSRYLRAEPPLDARLRVRIGSFLLPQGELEPGRALEASELRRYPELRSLTAALARVPSPLVASPLWVDVGLSQRTSRLEFHARSGSLLIRSDAASLPISVWLHELGHARLRGTRPNAELPSRLLNAIDEGAADYFAACLSGSPRLGDATELRDLSAPSPIGDSEWASLAFPSFDPHRVGWALAARLYAEEPQPGPLLDAVVACLDGDSALDAVDSPASAVQTLLDACPAASRARISRTLRSWLPPQLALAPGTSP